MSTKRNTLKLQKSIAVILHLIFLLVAMLGISCLYLNHNYGKGLFWLKTEQYEQTEQFANQVQDDVSRIFNYVNYKDVFESNGEIDYSKDILSVKFNGGKDATYNLDELMRIAKSRGYYLDDNFTVQHDDTVDVREDRETVGINWRTYMPSENYKEPGDAYSTIENLAVETLTKLGEYYTIRYNFVEQPSNFYFMVSYQDNYGLTSLYTNAKDKTVQQLVQMGQYLYLSGDSINRTTNMTSPPVNVTTLLASYNPYENNNSFMAVAVDTTYPHLDEYSMASFTYQVMRNRYITGIIALLIGLAGCLFTVFYLIMICGHKEKGSSEIHLLACDHVTTETSLLVSSLLILLGLYLADIAGSRILHLIFKKDHWYYVERLMNAGIIYLICLGELFGLIRRYKAGTLWSNSSVKKISNGFSLYMENHTFCTRLTLNYLLFLLCNLTFMLALFYLFLQSRDLTATIEFWTLAALITMINLKVYFLLFKISAEKDQIDEAIRNISSGDTGYKVDLSKFSGKERKLAENVNNISLGLESALQEKVKSERLKADLITNVSHDIKTPLTSIINYIDLIKREHLQNDKIQGYLEVLDQKSQRLKNLTEDLVEASKASSGNLKLEIAYIDIAELVAQTNGEFEEKFALRKLELVIQCPEKELIIEADGRRLWRVLENLYNNACKYAMEHSRVYVEVGKSGDNAVFTIKNVSENPLNIHADELTERFVRGDVARTTEGSGLGLSIAKSLTELQNGTFEIYIDGDFFKVQVSFPLKKLV